MTNKDCKNIGYAFCGIIGFIVSIVSIIVWVEYASNLDISEVQCYVNKVDIPLSLPNNTYNYMWAECDCGNHCWTKTPVADIYVQLHGEEDNVRVKYINNKKDKGYTVYDDKCPDGENIVNRMNRLDEIQKYKVYENTTRTCYKDGADNVYLFNHEYDIVPPAVITGILAFILLCIFLIYFFCNEQKKIPPEILSQV